MATVKITDLPYITSLQPNTANTVIVGVDVPGDYTGQMTLTTLARGLYSHNYLVVGDYDDVYPNAVATFAGVSNNYVQTIIENIADDGSSDFVAQANVSTDTAHFIDVGFTGNSYDNSSPDNSLGTSVQQLDGYIYVQGKAGEKGGNLTIGTASANTLINFIVGGVNSENVVAYMTPSGIYSPSINSLVAANVATINSSITSNVASANLFTQAAFNKANNALANTTGTFAGDLSITGNLNLLNGSLSSAGNMTVNGTMILANSNFSPTESALTITASQTVVTPSNDGYMIHISGKQNVASRIVADSYGPNTYVVFAGRTARGNVTNPTAVQTGDVLMRISGNGYGSTGYSPLGVGRIDIVATQTHTDSARGSQIQFWNMPTGSNTLTNIATFNGESAVFTGVVNPQKGFAYTPNNMTTVATTFTLDFARDSMIRLSINDNATITLSNYQTGKIVEMWITNSAGQNKTITHGCLANNSTSKLTTFTIQSNSCAFLKYFSIDGDQTNTFVSITA